MTFTANFPRISTFCIAAWMIASSAACGSEGTAGTATAFASGVFAGDVEGTSIRVGVVATAHRARVFFCDTETKRDKAQTQWLTANIDVMHKLSFQTTDAGRWSLVSGQLDTAFQTAPDMKTKLEVGTAFSGVVNLGDGTPRAFHAKAAPDKSIVGLYEGTAACGRVGLIVTQPKADAPPQGQGACVGMDTLAQVNPLDPIVRGDDLSIRVTVGDAMEETTVKPAAPPEE